MKFVNWKTNVGGLIAIIAAIGCIVHALQHGGGAGDILGCLGLGSTGVGLLNAKDNNTTGAGETAKKVK